MFKHDVQEKTPVDINKLVLSVLALVQIDLQKQKIELQTQLETLLAQSGHPTAAVFVRYWSNGGH